MGNELWIYDVIGSGFFEEGVTASSVRDDLAKLDKSQRLLVRINSPGGDVSHGLAIRTLLAEWPAGVDVQIDGIALSAASFIATIGDNVAMADGAMLMIHDPWTMTVGNADDHAKATEVLEKVAGSLVEFYAARSGQDADTVRAAMKAETWFTADEAIAWGLADEKVAERVAAYAIPAAFGYRHAPQGSVKAPQRGQARQLSAFRNKQTLTEAKKRANNWGSNQ